jgi:hypothetical protein
MCISIITKNLVSKLGSYNCAQKFMALKCLHQGLSVVTHACNPSRDKRIQIQGWPRQKCETLSEEWAKSKRTRSLAQVGERLPSKHKALSSIPSEDCLRECWNNLGRPLHCWWFQCHGSRVNPSPSTGWASRETRVCLPNHLSLGGFLPL